MIVVSFDEVKVSTLSGIKSIMTVKLDKTSLDGVIFVIDKKTGNIR